MITTLKRKLKKLVSIAVGKVSSLKVIKSNYFPTKMDLGLNNSYSPRGIDFIYHFRCLRSSDQDTDAVMLYIRGH